MAEESASTPASYKDFEIDAFDVLDSAPSYEEGVNSLINKYKESEFDDPVKAKEVLSTYSRDLQYKFSQPNLDFNSIVDIVPTKPQLPAEDTPQAHIQAVNDWEESALKFFGESDDADIVALRDSAIPQVKAFASESRRDARFEEDSISSLAKDKFYRFAEGVVGPFAKLAGADELDRALLERTQRGSDAGVAGLIAYGLGATAPFVAATVAGGPVAGLAVAGLQGAGEAKATYEQGMEATGDPAKAAEGAALVGLAQAAGFIPVGRVASKLASSVLGKTAEELAVKGASKTVNDALVEALNSQKGRWGNVPKSALEAGLIGSAATTLSNIGRNIALDENGDITAGIAEQFLAQAMMGGAFSGAHTLMQNATIEQAKGILKNANKAFEAEAQAKATKPKGKPVAFVEEAEAPLFRQNEKGFWEETETKKPTVEERIKEQENYNKAEEEFLAKEVPGIEEDITNEYGEKVEPEVTGEPDPIVDALPQGVTLISENPTWRGGSGATAMTQFAQKFLGSVFSLNRNVLDGAYGAQYGDGRIRLLRSLGSNTTQFVNTVSHEIGHALDSLLNNFRDKTTGLAKIVEKMAGLKGLLSEALPEGRFNFRVAKLSSEWRPGWDGVIGNDTKFQSYRSQPEEMYADVIGALLNDFEGVKQRYPDIYNAFEDSLNRNPELQVFWEDYKKLATDPQAMLSFKQELKEDAYKKHTAKEREAREAQVANRSYSKRMKNAIDLSYRLAFDAIRPARDKLNSLSPEDKQAGWELFDAISKRNYYRDEIDTHMREPLKKLWTEFLQTEIDPNDWSMYEYAKQVRDDETTTMGRVKEEFETYRLAAMLAKVFLKDHPRIKDSAGVLNKVVNTLDFSKIDTPDKLNDALSQLPLLGDITSLLNKNDFLARYPNDPDGPAKATRDYNLAVARLNRRKKSQVMEELQDYAQKIKGVSPEVKEALIDITRDNAFAARKYLVNEGGYTVKDANETLATLKQKLGEKQVMLDDVSKRYHDIVSYPITSGILEKSGIWGPDLLLRLNRNKSNYVTNLVLKHFQGDDKVSAGVRSAIGTLNESGNPLNATATKMEALLVRSYMQQAENGAVKLARMTDDAELVARANPKTNIYEKQATLRASDPENSYLIEYSNGKAGLYKVRGKAYGEMFTQLRDANLPGLNLILETSDALNKVFLTRQLKTIFNPAFVLMQKYYDRALEKIVANSLEPSFGIPRHLFNSKLKPIDASTRAELKHYEKTGELTGSTKTAIQMNVATNHLATIENNGLRHDPTFVDSIYDLYGDRPINEINSRLDKIGQLGEKTLEKIGFGFFKNLAEFDELRSKINGFKIGKELLGMTDAQAAVFARERFGVPNPRGGGMAAPLMNRMFLFGNAHLSGLRALAANIKDFKSTAATQLAVRVILPKLLLSSAVMVPAMKLIYGDEEAGKYQALYDMIPEAERMNRNPILIGAQDGQGNFHNFFDIKLKDIQADWKAVTIRMPQSREITTVTKAFWPLMKGDITGVGSALGASVQPMIQYMANLLDLTTGKNPTDYYRNKPILPNDIAVGGSFLEKGGAFGKYVASQVAPGVIPYNPFETSEPKGGAETAIKRLPLAGPMMRSLIGITNYGLIEKNKKADDLERVENAEIRLSTDEFSKELMAEYKGAAATIDSLGAKWGQAVGPQVAKRYRMLTSWNSTWRHFLSELQASKDAGDSDRYAYVLSQLRRVSKTTLDRLPSSEAQGEN